MIKGNPFGFGYIPMHRDVELLKAGLDGTGGILPLGPRRNDLYAKEMPSKPRRPAKLRNKRKAAKLSRRNNRR